ncbi:carbohydrate esterase family 4 protein [Amanita thiersii Skay4041]|uniref:Carbohydrate esterase family 4 protein n=1 Tax=Amanita thiersii Skay4041 TaxID=703135 RepID=A0A2A9NG97_9AGAR|nr:carbohydrate esterase family 4 protein [Amanita thiersii Skay4041]
MAFVKFLQFALAVVSTMHSAIAYPLTASASKLQSRAPAAVYHCTTPNTVALTFDDGPWQYLYDITNSLASANASGTFFFNGRNWGCIYDEDSVNRVRHAYNNGHQIASHTWSHKNLSQISEGDMHREFSLIDEAISKITGAVPAFMRPPYGESNDKVLEVAAAHGQTVAIWDFDNQDTLGKSPEDSKRIYDDAIRRHPSTILTINHEVKETTAHQVIPYAITELKKAGYRLVTLAECLGRQPYKSIGSPQNRDGSWTCNK